MAATVTPITRAARKGAKAADRRVARTFARPGRIVRARTGSAAQLAWTLIVTLLGLAFLALVLRLANTQPGVVVRAFNVGPDALRRFVNPFDDNPLATPKKKPARRAPAPKKAKPA